MSKNDWYFLTALLFCATVSFVIIYLHYPPNQYIPTIEVNGKICEVKFKQDGVNSHGWPHGHDVAICPK